MGSSPTISTRSIGLNVSRCLDRFSYILWRFCLSFLNFADYRLSIVCSAVGFIMVQPHQKDRLSCTKNLKCSLRKYTREWGLNGKCCGVLGLICLLRRVAVHLLCQVSAIVHSDNCLHKYLQKRSKYIKFLEKRFTEQKKKFFNFLGVEQ